LLPRNNDGLAGAFAGAWLDDMEITQTDGLPPGLSTAEARRRLADIGSNATPDTETHPLRLLLGKFVAPVPCLLEAAIALQLVLGEYVEASIVGVLLVFNAALGLLHEGRAQATVKALKSRLALSASVRRDGEWTIIPAVQLVPGDIVKLTLGSVVAADVRLIAGAVLLDQSTLTGESMPIEAGPQRETWAGALVRRGEAVAEVTTTGARTKFGRTAELVRTAHVVSSEEKAVFRVVRNLAGFNGAIALALTAYAYWLGMSVAELVPLILIAILGTIPVALPATFTLATAIGAQALAKSGILPTRLSAVHEAASMDVLCADKTGTLTMNELAVGVVRAMSGFDESRVLALAALASSEGGQDPVDIAVRAAASKASDVASLPVLIRFVPFDPAVKMSEAIAVEPTGTMVRIAKGAFAVIAALTQQSPVAANAAAALEAQGYRVLGVAAGPPQEMQLAGLIALSDPPRMDAAPCITALQNMGVRTIMVTGDAGDTAAVVARAVGLEGAIYPSGKIAGAVRAEDFAVFAGVLPEDKYRLVKGLQNAGHIVGMCGDGANDAPALRQAQIGIAVATATDVAKSAAGIVLTEPGLASIVAAVREGRITFQRILTYTLRSIVHKTRQVLFLAIGLALTGHAILTPMLVVLSMITGDFLAMSSTTDNVCPSARPNAWRVDNLTIAGIIIGICDLAFCVAVLATGKFQFGLDIDRLRTLTLVTLLFSGQAIFYVVRERRRLWSSWPSRIVIASSIADLSIIPTMAVNGILMAPLPIPVVLGVFAASLALALALDQVKVAVFSWLRMV
jgi:H+-transporting ATPase